MECPNCGTVNDDAYRFCMKCGTKLIAEAEASATELSEHLAGVPQTQPVAHPTGPQPALQRYYQPLPQHQALQPPSLKISFPQRQLFGAPRLSALNIWGPFAGYGTRRHHVAWLMDGQGPQAEALISKVETKFKERQIPNTTVTQEVLVARGLLVENRPYFILRRGLVSVALYIRQFGRDLFISLAAYLKSPISNFRVLILFLMLLFQGYVLFIYPNSVNSAIERTFRGLNLFGGTVPDLRDLLILLCIVGPLGALISLVLVLFLCFSLYKWLTERDFFAALRVQPNEFNEDDLMAMMKAVEQTVRISLDEIGLNPDDLKPAGRMDRQRII